MVKCWVSDTLTTIHGLTNDDCKNAIDEISENISLMEIMMGGEGSGHRCGDLCSSVGRRQRCLHTNDETSLLLRAAPHCCCCCCKKTVVPPGRMFEPINIHLVWLWKLVKTKRWKKDEDNKEEAAASCIIKCLQEIWSAIIVLTFNYGSPLNTLSLLTSHDTNSITSRHNIFFASLDSVK